MTIKDKYINMAILTAYKSNMRCKHGCVVVYKGRIIATGYNHHCKHYIIPPRKEIKIAIHAEIAACSNVKSSILPHCTIYIVRIKNDILVNSKPCNHCQEWLIRKNVKMIYYST